MLRLLLAFVLVVMVMGEGCCPPNAWEGFIGSMSGFIKYGVPHSTKSLLKYHTNSTLGMIDMEGDVIIDRWPTQKIRTIFDNNKNIEYVIMNGRCSKRILAQNATRVLNTYVGAGPETLAVKVYRFMLGDIEVYSTVTADRCIPVNIVATGTHPAIKAEYMEVEQLSGITVGVKDPSVFDIPSICHSADVSTDYVPIMSLWMPTGFY